MKRVTLITAILLQSFIQCLVAGDGETGVLEVLRRPLSKVDALNFAIAHNGTIRQAQKDVETAAGIAIQTKAIIYPHLIQTADHAVSQDSLVEANQDREIPPFTITLPAPIGDVTVGGVTLPKFNNQIWAADIRVVQSIYEGGRMLSAVRSSRLIREQSVLAYESIVADTLLSVSNAYDDALRGAMQVDVRAASVRFLGAYLNQTTDKYNAGSLPEFDVLRQSVELSNSQALHVQAIGDYRIAKQRLVELLGYDLPTTVTDDLSLNLTTPLQAVPYEKSLPVALGEALQHRTEIAALEKEELLGNEAIIVARAGYQPSVQAFAGYELTSRAQSRTAADELHGALIGAQLSWSIFDGFLTKGRVDEAVARRGRTSEAKAETSRIVELQVRTAWSQLRTARAVLEAQTENVRKAQRALELAQIRFNEGAATQIDVLDAQTALTDAHGSYVNALRDHSVARASLLRATGADLIWQGGRTHANTDK